MAKTALIVEDDEATAKVLAALCSQLGLEASICRNGKEGLEQARAMSPDLVLLDLLLPGMDGFKVAEGLKAAGLRSRLIAISGVYKDPKLAKDFADRFGGEFFQKPVRNDELSEAIGRLLGLAKPQPAPEAPRRASLEALASTVGPMEGSLRERPFVRLVMELFRGRASGTLDLTQGQMRKRVFFNRGFVRFAQSNIKAENVGGMQVAEGTVTEEQFRAAVGRARAERIGIGEALALAGVISYDALAKAQRRQVEEVCVTAFTWRDGSFKFTPGDTDRIQDARHDPVAVVLAAYRRFVTPEHARAQLSAYAKGLAARGPDFDRSLFTLRGVFPGETLTPMINGRQTVSEIVARARPEDLVLLWALIDLEIATLSGLERPKQPARQVAAAPARPYTVEEEAARALIAAEYERVMNAPDLFAVLRLTRGASPEDAKAAYLPLAKRFHADAFSGLMLGEAEDKARDLFARIVEAHATLTDPVRRADYEVLLERKDAGLPTDMEIIFKAENAYSRGDALVKQGRLGEAEAAFREALKLDASVAQYHVALGQVLLKGRGATAAAEAREALDKALAINAELPLARTLKAVALDMEGDSKAAEKLLREVLAMQPDNVDANREWRALKERQKKNDGKGLLGKLFKR
jgi:CheY-like chemotaxis protein